MSENQHIDLEDTDEVRAIEPITLPEMDSIKLMNRIDSKYLTNESVLLTILRDAHAEGYRALVVEGKKVSPYNSMYYDTPELRMFLDHHNRRMVRQKVRTRVYVASGQTFLEIKHKNNKKRTKKKRTEIDNSLFFDFRSDAAAADFLANNSAFTVDSIVPQMETIFNRITLVNAAKTERLTIDTNLRFVNHTTGLKSSLKNAVIIELKQDGRADSQMKRILLNHRVKPTRMSKYCIGTTITNPNVKSNRFKKKIRRIEKVINSKIECYD